MGIIAYANCKYNMQFLKKYTNKNHEWWNGKGYTDGRKESNFMPNIKPISDLRNYSEVLHDVAVGALPYF